MITYTGYFNYYIVGKGHILKTWYFKDILEEQLIKLKKQFYNRDHYLCVGHIQVMKESKPAAVKL